MTTLACTLSLHYFSLNSVLIDPLCCLIRSFHAFIPKSPLCFLTNSLPMSPFDAIPILTTASHFYCFGNEADDAAIPGKRMQYQTANIAFSLIPLPVIPPYRVTAESYRKPFFGAMPTTTFHGTAGVHPVGQ
jgi:hypothetical protein